MADKLISYFDRLQDEYRGLNMKRSSQASRTWFMKRVEDSVKKPGQKTIESSNSGVSAAGAIAGKMYFFGYDPKHKKTLPYYDRFPLIFPFSIHDDGFIGINFHYLAYFSRAKLMDSLVKYIDDKKYSPEAMLKISWSILSAASKFPQIAPCVKKYLTTHVKTNLIPVPPQSWDIALFLPVADFAKASQETVWQESVKKMRRLG